MFEKPDHSTVCNREMAGHGSSGLPGMLLWYAEVRPDGLPQSQWGGVVACSGLHSPAHAAAGVLLVLTQPAQHSALELQLLRCQLHVWLLAAAPVSLHD